MEWSTGVSYEGWLRPAFHAPCCQKGVIAVWRTVTVSLMKLSERMRAKRVKLQWTLWTSEKLVQVIQTCQCMCNMTFDFNMWNMFLFVGHFSLAHPLCHPCQWQFGRTPSLASTSIPCPMLSKRCDCSLEDSYSELKKSRCLLRIKPFCVCQGVWMALKLVALYVTKTDPLRAFY